MKHVNIWRRLLHDVFLATDRSVFTRNPLNTTATQAPYRRTVGRLNDAIDGTSPKRTAVAIAKGICYARLAYGSSSSTLNSSSRDLESLKDRSNEMSAAVACNESRSNYDEQNTGLVIEWYASLVHSSAFHTYATAYSVCQDNLALFH